MATAIDLLTGLGGWSTGPRDAGVEGWEGASYQDAAAKRETRKLGPPQILNPSKLRVRLKTLLFRDIRSSY